MSGGTGSGLTALLLEEIRNQYENISIISFTVFPSARLSSWIIEPLNFALGFMYQIEHTNINIWYDNETLYNIWEFQWMIEYPSFDDINKLIINHASSILSPIRFNNNEWSSKFYQLIYLNNN